ncbi:MAG: GTPase HflX, partial [Fenollaria timonensis]
MERAIIYTIEFDSKTDEYLDELEALLEACDAEAIVRVKQSKDVLNPRYYMGKGKLNEIKTLIEANDIDLLVVNDELSGVQTRNLEDELDIKVVDRTNLILDIFALRAETVEAKLLVELAQLA